MRTLVPFSRVLLVVALATLAPSPLLAHPRDEVLKLAPPDAALVLVVQNAAGHLKNIQKSPFLDWFLKSSSGKAFSGLDPQHLKDAARPVFDALGVTPEALFEDVFGDAVAFAFTPAAGGAPERAMLLVRPRKPEALVKLVDRVNELQTSAGELKGVVRRPYNGGEYFERQKTAGGSEYYCFRDHVFAFSATEADVRGALDRGDDRPHARRFDRLGLADAAAALLINPRALDHEVRAKVAAARADEKAFLERFAAVWAGLDSAAAYASLGADLEVGVALDFRPDGLSPLAREWLTGARAGSRMWSVVPETALVAACASVRLEDVLTLARSALPEEGVKSLTAAIEGTLGPILGKDRLPAVLKALGPNWAVWAEPPAAAGQAPVVVGAVQLSVDGPKGRETTRAIQNAVGFGFQTARVAYNSTHPDQIVADEQEDGDVLITSFTNPTLFPRGFQPTFAVKDGFLIVAGSPGAVRRFRAPTSAPAGPDGEALLARFSAAHARDFLRANRADVAKFLASAGKGDEKDLLGAIDSAVAALEPLDRVDVAVRGTATGLRLSARVKPVKPLK